MTPEELNVPWYSTSWFPTAAYQGSWKPAGFTSTMVPASMADCRDADLMPSAISMNQRSSVLMPVSV